MKRLHIIKRWFKNRGDKTMMKQETYYGNTDHENLIHRIETLEKLLTEKNLSIERAKSLFLKNIYHEIRTPLNSIVGFSNLIELNASALSDSQKYVSHIRESSRDFLRTIDAIIEAAMIEAGVFKMREEECNLFNLLSELHTNFSVNKHKVKKNIALSISVTEAQKNVNIYCDPYRVRQILSNLLWNAIKYTDNGIIEFGFRVRRKVIEFFVKDTGVGGLEGKEDHIFKNFSKVDESDTSPDGLGLGLGIAKSLVEKMNGRIWYKSMENKGSTFYFTLPIKTRERNIEIKEIRTRKSYNRLKIRSQSSVALS